MTKATKPCKQCWKDMPKGLQAVCSFACDKKRKAEKEKAKKTRDRERKKVSIKALTKKADTLWSALVKYQWNNICAYDGCNKTTWLNSHHLFTRARKSTRWRGKNWIPLCSRHHIFSEELSAHKTPLEFYQWLEVTFWKEWIEERMKKSQEVYKVTSEWLQEIIIELEASLSQYRDKM